MRVAFLALGFALLACGKKPGAPTPVASSAPVVAADAGPAASVAATPPADAGTSATSTWPAALPVPTLPAAAPIAVDGYPTPIATCLPDPAYLAGFTKDGAEFGYCMQGMGTKCELVDRAGKKRVEVAGGPDPDRGVGKSEDALEKSMRALGIPELVKKDCTLLPNPIKGSFRYGDIKLEVLPSDGKLLKVGGSVGSDAPVFPFAYARPKNIPTEVGLELNVLALSPDETEIGLVTHAFFGEYTDQFEIARMPVARFAAGIYNDLGFAAYKAKNLDKARDLFLRAAYIDSANDLAAYNLACVYAKQSDATHAEAALKLATARGGDAVKKRARADKDFAGVKDAAWFVALTSP